MFGFLLLLIEGSAVHFETGMFAREIKKFNLMQIFCHTVSRSAYIKLSRHYVPVWQVGQKINER
jgi:hypothetical protein